jgi:outer membrane immunogenic protein
MKKYLFGSAALILLASAANAADLPRKAPLAPPPPVYDWNGFYIGGFFSTTASETKAHTDPPFTTAGGHTGVAGGNDGSIGVGGTIGYNWQFAPTWLLGIEGEFGTLGVDRTIKDFNDQVIVGSKSDWYGTLRGRFGYVTGPSLLYVTGGAAFVNITDTFGGGAIAPTVAVPAIANTTTKTGWTVGGGIETKLSRNWSATAEYLFIDAGSTDFGSNPLSIPGTPTTFDHTYHVVKTGLNYKLDGHWDGLPFFGASMLPSNHNWGGFYAGVNIGGGMSLVHAFDVGTTPGGGTDIPGTGFAGGGQVGYNYILGKMFLGTWFVGLEGDIGYLGVRGSVNDWFDTIEMFQVKTNWYATARGRIGTTTGPALLYFTAGGAWVNLEDGFAATVAPFPGDVSSRTASGWTVGGGTEVALDSRWSARLESLYIDVGHREHTDTIPAPFFADFKDRFMVVRAGLNYQFGGPDVVTTKY